MSGLTTLTDELVKLVNACNDADVPIVVGGGLGLFLRDVYIDVERSPRYPTRPESRSTDDIDCLLSRDVITSAEKMETLRDIITRDLGYEPLVKHLQFGKDLESGGKAKIDLLAALPADRSTLRVKLPRIRPNDAKNIHAYATPEAATLTFEPRTLQIRDCTVSIPASINYLILKLHAFRDRRDDDSVDFGRHHAFDVFRIVTDMDEDDWTTARKFQDQHGDDEHVAVARRIRADFFDGETDLGILRLRENVGFKNDSEEFSSYLPDFLSDLRELFPGLE